MSDESSEIPRAQNTPQGTPQDANDPRRDPMGPPEVPCECYCLHCERVFMSDLMWFQRVVGDPNGFLGYWMCPTPNCDGAGFTFDIHAIDPAHPSNEDCYYSDDEDDFDDEEDFEDDEEFDSIEALKGDEVEEYDPDESKYKDLDERLGEGDDDLIDGDEWKLGLAPGEPIPPQMYWPEAQRREWEEEQKKYDGPDHRPRELDWSDREFSDDKSFKEDDIPF